MSGEDPEDKKVENPAADDDPIDDESLDDVFEADETFDVDGDFEADPEAAEAIAERWLKHQTSQLEKQPVNRSTVDATLSDLIRLADELVKKHGLRKFMRRVRSPSHRLSNRWRRSSVQYWMRLRRQHVHRQQRLHRPPIL